MDYSMKMGIFFSVVMIIAYIIGFAITISCRTTDHKCSEDSFEVMTIHRDANTKDAWMALIWPLFALYKLFCAILYILNNIVHYTLLLVGIHYENTKLYKKLEGLI